MSTDTAPRCWRCGKLLAESVTRPWRIRCWRCRALNGAPPPCAPAFAPCPAPPPPGPA